LNILFNKNIVENKLNNCGKIKMEVRLTFYSNFEFFMHISITIIEFDNIMSKIIQV